MTTLKGQHINLRALEPEDLDFLYQIENETAFWEVSNTQTPFSKYILKHYLENTHLDIFEAKQLRLLIEHQTEKHPIGMIDLFDFDPKNKRAGVGILIHPNYQNKKFATEALSILIAYAFHHLDLHQLYANITLDNTKSIALFEKLQFKKSGVKKDWTFCNGKFKDEILYQLIKQ